MNLDKQAKDAIKYLETKGYAVEEQRTKKSDKKLEDTIEYVKTLGYAVKKRTKNFLNPNFIYLIKTIANNGRCYYQTRKSEPGKTSALNEEYAKVDVRKLKWIKMRRI